MILYELIIFRRLLIFTIYPQMKNNIDNGKQTHHTGDIYCSKTAEFK